MIRQIIIQIRNNCSDLDMFKNWINSRIKEINVVSRLYLDLLPSNNGVCFHFYMTIK